MSNCGGMNESQNGLRGYYWKLISLIISWLYSVHGMLANKPLPFNIGKAINGDQLTSQFLFSFSLQLQLYSIDCCKKRLNIVVDTSLLWVVPTCQDSVNGL